MVIGQGEGDAHRVIRLVRRMVLGEIRVVKSLCRLRIGEMDIHARLVLDRGARHATGQKNHGDGQGDGSGERADIFQCHDGCLS